jgi:hypothetical protein
VKLASSHILVTMTNNLAKLWDLRINKGAMSYKKECSLVVLLILVMYLGVARPAASSSVGPDLERGLVAYWKFDEGEGDIAFDATGEQNDGALLCNGTACAPPRWVPQAAGYALEFDGFDGFVHIPFSPSLQPTEGITLSALIYPNSLPEGGGQMQIVTHEAFGYRFAVVGSRLSLLVKLPDSDEANPWGEVSYAAGEIAAKRWHYVAATYSSQDGRIRLYIDGELVGVSKPFSGGEGKMAYLRDAPVTLGRGGTSGWRRAFQGLIDEVCIYNRALSEEEIQALYRQVRSE